MNLRGADWADGAFGDDVHKLRLRIPVALAAAHTRARAGHDATASTSRRVYGNGLWEFQYEELARELLGIDGSRIAKFGGYQLVVLADHVFFPLRYSDRAGVPVERARLERPVSAQRERLFGAHAPEIERVEPLLDEAWEELVPADQHEVFPQLGQDTQLVVVAYACNLEAGVLQVEWGQAEHVGDGELRWGEHSMLPLPATPLVAAAGGLTLAGHATGAPWFDSAKEPEITLGLRHPGDVKLEVPPQTEHRPDEPQTQDNDEDR
ncbi:hypothetical protein [Amycolatopsis sp. NPDC021455]|uniref:hypothetical protein n=1 Tax=Amycolatopsis sp. NPDC021455 TaxID=3154901 RepID=UPI0033E53B8F